MDKTLQHHGKNNLHAWLRQLRICREERGVSVLEVIAVLMIFSMIAVILYSFLLMGMTMYSRVTSETLLRNQANAVFASIINEISDSIYVQQDGDQKKIRIVKWANSTDSYIQEYAYAFVPEVEDATDEDGNVKVKTFGVTNEAFSMKGTFDVLDQESLVVTLDFYKKREHLTSKADEVEITIKQQIPLFRMD
mgnify:CR=1 FL=1